MTINRKRLALHGRRRPRQALDGRRDKTQARSSMAEDDEHQLRTATLGSVLGVHELASLFQCSTAKINRRCRSGELPAFKFGKSWFVRERDLETYIQRRLRTPIDTQQH